MNVGGSAIADVNSGRWSSDAFRIGGTSATVAGTIDTSLLTSIPPSNVLRTYAQGPISQNGGVLRYDLPLPDGQYNIRLIFLEPTANGPNQRKFDIAFKDKPF